jgi:hypothetical protein
MTEDDRRVGALLSGAFDLLAKHPLPLLAPLVLLGLLTAGSGPAYGPQAYVPWWLFPIAVLVALVAFVIALVVLAIMLLAWLLTFEAALHALDSRGAPSMAHAWETVWRRVADLGAELGRAWALTEGHRGDLLLAFLALLLADVVAGWLVGWLPFLGAPLRGVANGVFGAGVAAMLAVYVHRTRHGPA